MHGRPEQPDVHVHRRRTARNAARIATGAAVSAGLLWLLFGGADWAALWRALAGLSWPWMIAAQFFGWATYFTRAARWRSIACAAHPVRYRAAFSAAQIGGLVNLAVIPRLGEFVRALVLARLSGITFSKSFSTAALDRVTDLIALLVLLLVSAAAFPVDRDIVIPAEILRTGAPVVVSTGLLRPTVLLLGGLVGAALAVLVLLYARRGWVLAAMRFLLHPFPPALADRLCHGFGEFADGMHVLRSWRGLVVALLWSLATWGLSLLTVDAVLRAFVEAPPWYASVVLLTMTAVFLLVNVAPGLVGQFHLGVIAGMLFAVPGASLAETRAVALVSHFCALYPTVILGVYCLLLERVGLAELLRRAR
jgi:uncharacterized protein (TIRG00374 family)